MIEICNLYVPSENAIYAPLLGRANVVWLLFAAPFNVRTVLLFRARCKKNKFDPYLQRRSNWDTDTPHNGTTDFQSFFHCFNTQGANSTCTHHAKLANWNHLFHVQLWCTILKHLSRRCDFWWCHYVYVGLLKVTRYVWVIVHKNRSILMKIWSI